MKVYQLIGLLTYTLMTSTALAAVTLPLEGHITESDGGPILVPVSLKVEVLHPVEDCVLRTETFNSVNTIDGYFLVQLGSDTTTTPSLEQSLNNDYMAANNPCSTATPAVVFDAVTSRRLAVSFDKGDGYQRMDGEVPLGYAPYAMMARSLEGKTVNDFVHAPPSDFSQIDFNDLFTSNTNFIAELKTLVDGDSGKYLKSGTSLDVSNAVISNVGPPALGTDATNKNYVDGKVDGKIAGEPFNIDFAASTPGDVLSWNGSQWVTASQSTPLTESQVDNFVANNNYLVKPTADGSAGDVLTTDGAGNFSWNSASGGGALLTTGGTMTGSINTNGNPAVESSGDLHFATDESLEFLTNRSGTGTNKSIHFSQNNNTILEITNTAQTGVNSGIDPAVGTMATNHPFHVKGNVIPANRYLATDELILNSSGAINNDIASHYSSAKIQGTTTLADEKAVIGSFSEAWNLNANLQPATKPDAMITGSMGLAKVDTGQVSKAFGVYGKVENLNGLGAGGTIELASSLIGEVYVEDTITSARGLTIRMAGDHNKVTDWRGIYVESVPTGAAGPTNQNWGVYLEDGVNMRVHGAISQGVTTNPTPLTGSSTATINFTNQQLWEWHNCSGTGNKLQIDGNSLKTGSTYKVFVHSATSCRLYFSLINGNGRTLSPGNSYQPPGTAPNSEVTKTIVFEIVATPARVYVNWDEL